MLCNKMVLNTYTDYWLRIRMIALIESREEMDSISYKYIQKRTYNEVSALTVDSCIHIQCNVIFYILYTLYMS
jgi:hypothetical protein